VSAAADPSKPMTTGVLIAYLLRQWASVVRGLSARAGTWRERRDSFRVCSGIRAARSASETLPSGRCRLQSWLRRTAMVRCTDGDLRDASLPGTRKILPSVGTLIDPDQGAAALFPPVFAAQRCHRHGWSGRVITYCSSWRSEEGAVDVSGD
jgi:hypothetical protein